jgi:hypothetical protein
MSRFARKGIDRKLNTCKQEKRHKNERFGLVMWPHLGTYYFVLLRPALCGMFGLCYGELCVKRGKRWRQNMQGILSVFTQGYLAINTIFAALITSVGLA